MNTYPIHEMFYTFQGEGVHAGQPAFFIRLFGCPVHCPWCDSAGTWHPHFVPQEIHRLTPAALTQAVLECVNERGVELPIVVITGGEPAIYDLHSLTKALHDAEFCIHLETSGAFPVRGDFEWITLSPKKWSPPLSSVVEQAHEFKLIIEDPSDIALYTGLLHSLGLPYPSSLPLWLHPEWSQRENECVLEAIVRAVKKHEEHYRAGWQMHKLYKVDQHDKRSQPPVPLGGDLNKGY